MASPYLSKLSIAERDTLVGTLHKTQEGVCFICQQPKQASDLRVARVLATFDRIRLAAGDRGPNLGDVLRHHGGAKHMLGFTLDGAEVRYSLGEVGDNRVRTVEMLVDKLSGARSFFARLPIEYLHHDDKINPRSIGGSLAGLVQEFHSRNPQLHVALTWATSGLGGSKVMVFDGQHKTTAQVLLGTTSLPVRVFVDPDENKLLGTNLRAGTTLRQVAFDKSVQRRLGRTLFLDRVERFRSDRGLAEDDESFSEQDIVNHFKGESREVRKYAVDSVRTAVLQDPDNRLTPYIEYGGKSSDKPLSYSTIEKTWLSFFVFGDVLSTALNHRVEEGLNPRDIEVSQIVRLMNVVADEIYVGKFEPELGAARVEYKVQHGEAPPEPHLRAYRMAKEEILGAWLRYVRQVIQTYFGMTGVPLDEERMFQTKFPDPLWDRLRTYVINLGKLPVWVNHELSGSVFGGKQNVEFWKVIFQTGRAPTGQQVLAQPLNLIEMINE